MKKPFYFLLIGMLLTFAQSNMMANNIFAFLIINLYVLNF
jgi:hypothetical protein